jgi:hypothetical protein
MPDMPAVRDTASKADHCKGEALSRHRASFAAVLLTVRRTGEQGVGQTHEGRTIASLSIDEFPCPAEFV